MLLNMDEQDRQDEMIELLLAKREIGLYLAG